MGGLVFILVSLLLSMFLCREKNRLISFSLAVVFAYMVVGLLDDIIKVKNKENQGLKAYQKIIFQFSIAIVVAVFCYKNSLTILHVPFINKNINVKIYIIPIVILVFLATTNTVNLTDGLDGLAGATSLIYLISQSIIIYLQIKFNNKIYLIEKEYENLIMLCLIFSASLFAFLLFNTNKASIFMGDTGSLALGGIISCVSIFSGNLLYIPIIGICFVISGVSVIVQVLYFKITRGKRLFLMAPLHHHLQKKGLTEAKIVYVYVAVTIVASLLCLLTYLR